MLAKAAIYLDSNAGAPPSPYVTEALLFFLKNSGCFVPNPSSIHSHGRSAKRALADARENVSRSFGVNTDPEQLLFTSSGSEANQLVIRSVLEAELAKNPSPHWITTSVEHDSVRQMVSWFEKRGGSVSLLPVNPNGVIQVEEVQSYLTPQTSLVSAVWVNNETGVISDVQRLQQITGAHGIPLHLDAAQAWGKIPMNIVDLGAEFVTFSGHKIGGLAGIGGVLLKRGSRLSPQILGKQEKGRRGGTENLLGIISVGAAASQLKPEDWASQIEPLRNRLEKAILDRIHGTWVHGGEAPRVANTLNLGFEGVEGDGLVMALDLAGYSVSSGSACGSGVLEPSHVLMAMGRTKLQAMAAIRISLSQTHPWDVFERFIEALEQTVARVREVKKRNTW